MNETVHDPLLPQPPTAGAALRAYAASELERCLAQLARPGLSRHTGIHQGRKSIRRVRACLALGWGRLGAKGEALDRRLRRLCRSLCGLRDAHAVLDTLKRWSAGLEPDARRSLRPAIRAARLALKQRRDALLAERLAKDPDLSRLRAKLGDCLGELQDLRWERVREAHLQASLDRSERRIARAARRAGRRGDIEDFHRWRRRLRRLRQQLTALEKSQLPHNGRLAPDPDELEGLAWRQDLDVLMQNVAALPDLDPALRRDLVLALQAPAAEPDQSASPS